MNTNNDDDEIFARELLKGAGPRPTIPKEDLASITKNAHAVWQQRYGKRRGAMPWLIAASVILAIAFGVWWSTRTTFEPAPALIVATVESVTGSVAVSPGESLAAGSIIETKGAASHVSLRMQQGQSLRLDAATRVRLLSPTLIELQDGAVYVDSMQSHDLAIRTKAGDFTPIGTQYEVRIDGPATVLRVREGRVAFEHEQNVDVASAGEELSIGAEGNIVRAVIRADDPRWQWAVALARIPAIEGRTLDSFLRWCAREKGWELEYADGNASSRASTTILHGSVDDLALDDALRSVALSSGIRYRVEDGKLIVAVS